MKIKFNELRLILSVAATMEAYQLAQCQLSSMRYEALTAKPQTSELEIRAIIEEILQGVRSSNSGRVMIHFKELALSSQSRDSLKSSFDRARFDGRSVMFAFDSIEVRVDGDNATVSLAVPDTVFKRSGLLLKRVLGRWQIESSGNLIQQIVRFLNRSASPRASGPSIAIASSAQSQSVASMMPLVIESQHMFIPRRFVTDPARWFITRNDAQQSLGKSIFSYLTDIEDVPLASSGGYITDGATFVLDAAWHRVVYASQNQTWVKSYGDMTGDYRLIDPRGMKAFKFPDGTINILIADAGRGEIVHLRYDHSAGLMTYYRSLKGPLQKPIDVDLNVQGASQTWPNYSIWVSDPIAGGLIKIDQNGNLVSTITQYTFGGVTRPLSNVTRLFVTGSMIGVIDFNQNAFVVVPTTPYVATVYTKFDPPSKLTSIGRSQFNWIVSDANLYRLHSFTNDGYYMGSFQSFNSNAASNPSVFSTVNGMPMMNWPQSVGIGGYWNNANLGYLDVFLGSAWSSNSGFSRLLPGADILNFSVSNPSGAIQFNYDLTNDCYLSSKIYNQNNVVVYDFFPSGYTFSGHRTDYVSFSQLGTGPFTMKLSVLPAQNLDYGEYQQNPVQINYSFSSPFSVSISGPSYLMFKQYGTYTANVTGGSGNCSYQWYVMTDCDGFWVTLGISQSQTYRMGICNFTIRCDVHDNETSQNASGSMYVYNDEGGAIAFPGDVSRMLPNEFSIAQNYPNPFNPETEILFGLPEPSSVRITISDVLGREILSLVDREYAAGFQKVTWKGIDGSGNKVGSGIYFYRIVALGQSGKQFTKVMKMLVTK